MAKTANRFNPKSLARIQNVLALLSEAKVKGKELTRQEVFNILVDRKKEKDGSVELNKFGQLIRDAIRLGHVGLKEIKDTKPPGRKWEEWENKIVSANSPSEAHKLLPHRGVKNITVQRHALKRIKPTCRAGLQKAVRFTPAEIETLKTNYPHMTNEELRQKFFPTRSIYTIGMTARRLGLRKTNGIVPTMDPNKKIIEDILHVANARGISAVQLDKILGAKGYFKWNWKNEHRRVHLAIVERASTFLGLRMRLEPLPEAPTFSHMVRQWKAMTCPVVDEKAGKPRLQKRAAPPRPSMKIGNHRPKDAILELAEAAVPRQHPCRQDVIHDVWEAVAKGELSIEDFGTPEGRQAIRNMANASRRQNFEMGGYARSMDAPLGDGTSTLHDLIAAE